MYSIPTNIEKLGFDKWFQDRVDSDKTADYQIARVTAVNKNSYVVHNGTKEMFAEISGKMMFNADSPLDYPAVGDWVYVQIFNEDSLSVIYEILPRKSLLKRKTAGKKIDFQLIAANIDTAMIMQSLDANYNLRRLERYLVMVHEGRIHPVVLLSKSDLSTPDEIEIRKTDIQKIMPDIRITVFSNQDHSGLDNVKELLIPGKTCCLLGSSGVGKTTLLNNLVGEALFDTQPVREKDSRGRHVTSRRQMIVLKNGAMIIDTPGMRELGNMAVESGLEDTFSDIAELTDLCRYRDCTHLREEGCAVLAAVEAGTLSEARYQNYIKMKKESAYLKLSYLEKRKKDKAFGKFVKSVMKDKNRENQK
jgi:ribosome biogenesis GTPase